MNRNLAITCCIVVLLFMSGRAVGQRKFKNTDALGIKIDVDDPDYGKAVITNESVKSLTNVKVTVREDYSYLDGGFITRCFTIKELAPHKKHLIPLVYVKDGVDIGGLDVWLECSQGKAHDRGQWSYAGTANIFENLSRLLRI